MYRIGIDLGGTHIGAGLVENGVLKAKKYVDTPSDREFHATVKAMAEAIYALLAENGVELSQCEAIGIGSPGVADEKTGNIVYSANFDWHDVPLRRELHSLVPLPIAIANDADAAGWAEYVAGAGKGSQSCVTITLGTGVGGGIVLNGKLFSGGMGRRRAWACDAGGGGPGMRLRQEGLRGGIYLGNCHYKAGAGAAWQLS